MAHLIIGVCGRKRHGKDTIGNILRARYGFQSCAFADPLKRVAMEIYGLTWNQCYGEAEDKESVDPRWGLSARVILQKLGTDIARSIHEETWIKNTLNNIQSACAGTGYIVRDDIERKFVTRPNGISETAWVITDLRFPNEAEAVQRIGGRVIRVVRPSLGIPTDEHPSETSVDLVHPDIEIINDGDVLDLRHKLETALNLRAAQ